jgi:hypothetical protein
VDESAPRLLGQATRSLGMSGNTARQLRHRHFDHLRQKLWAVPAWLWLCVFRRGAGKSARGRNLPVR